MSQEIKDPKKTWEVFGVLMGFGQNMEDGETINEENSSVIVEEVYTRTNVTDDLTNGSIYVQDGNMLGVVLKGGTSSKEYKVRFRAYVSEDKKLEEDLTFIVKD